MSVLALVSLAFHWLIYDRSLKVTLFDSLKKRLTFLESVMDELKLTNCTTLHGRAEDLSHQDYRESFDIATSRAVARLPILLEWTVPYVKEGGYVIALKGAIYEEEVGESNKALSTLKLILKKYVPLLCQPWMINEQSCTLRKQVKHRNNTHVNQKKLKTSR